MWNFANFHTLFDLEGWRNWDDRVQMVRTLRGEGVEDRKLDWSLGLKASEIKWEKLLKNIQDSLLRLGDRVKTDERNDCQNEREGRKNGRTLGFSCGNLYFASVIECRKMRGMGTKWDRGRNNGQSPRVFLWEAQYLILQKKTGSVLARAEMGCWRGYLEGQTR